jgi:RNA polymerase sigma factor (sigma-70 family)
MTDPRGRIPPLSVVQGSGGKDSGQQYQALTIRAEARDLEWSILMARAQNGDGEAYRRLLNDVTPYLRMLAARRLRARSDVEDAVQDILLTVHAIRQIYDPTRPFGPWLATIANRRLIDRLRRQGRLRARETPLAPKHENFPAEHAKLDDELSDRRELREAVKDLPPSQRKAIELLKLKEMSLKEASAATGMSVSSLKVATHRALASLRGILSIGGRH